MHTLQSLNCFPALYVEISQSNNLVILGQNQKNWRLAGGLEGRRTILLHFLIKVIDVDGLVRSHIRVGHDGPRVRDR
eukprot:SAG11_NODE_812_length_7059_cov_5.203017_9_plen_77_part_00